MTRDEIEKAAKEFLGTEYQVPDWLIDFALAMCERQREQDAQRAWKYCDSGKGFCRDAIMQEMKLGKE